jgi:predicted RNA-binding protein with PIN domain
MTNLASVLKYLEKERNRLGAQLERLNHALSVLIGTSDHRARRTISAAGRARIAAAQRARLAKVRRQKVVSILARKGRTISPAARKRIVAAQKTRWAKWRKEHKKA